MSVISVRRDWDGEVDIVRLLVTDTLATVATTGYLTAQAVSLAQANNGTWTWQPNDMVLVSASDGVPTFFTLSTDLASLLLYSTAGNGGVSLPVVDNHFAVFEGTLGALGDDGYAPSDATKTSVVMASGAVIANHIAVFTDTAGTIDDDATTAINAGSIQAGLSGTAGHLTSFPAAATSGSLSLTAVANSGDFAGVISNASLGQATTWSLADPGSSTANILEAKAALVSNNLVKASGTAGLIVDAGFALHAGTTAAYGGGGTSNAFVTTNMTASSVVSATIKAQSNAASIVSALPGVNTLTVTFSADPGAGTVINWVSVTPAG